MSAKRRTPYTHVGLRQSDYQYLKDAKQSYEARQGKTDWSDFLKFLALLGLGYLLGEKQQGQQVQQQQKKRQGKRKRK